MSLITIKTKYYQEKSQLENENNISNEIINKVKSLNFKGSSFLGFDDIALNFKINGIEKIVEFCNKLYRRQTNTLIIWTQKQNQLAIESCLQFIFGKSDYHKKQKIELVFINEQLPEQNVVNIINYYLNKNNQDNIALLFLDSLGHDDNQQQSIKNFISKFNYQSSEFLIKKSVYFIGRKNIFGNVDNISIPRENAFFVSNDIHPNFSLLSEIGLILLATQGINIEKLINGYTEANKNVLNPDIYFNNALKLALYLNENDMQNQLEGFNNINIAYDLFLQKYVEFYSSNLNQISLIQSILNTSALFPNDIPAQSENILSGNRNKFVIFWILKQRYFDYQLSSNIDNDDLIDQLKNYTMNQFNEKSYDVFQNYLTSFNDDVKSIEIQIENNSEEALGELISLAYWSKIFYCIMNDLDAFK
ncbi:hypothetical protein [Mycoplasmopsis verecunda]|uniref:Glucose-6-phosphate isomerase n=1 Tax=Mycoplasmopsis verecunda TaxID=171291 RepID=A0A1T4KK73_9BACT|nr:hypothetical protein [Mycoplasmopsis verecunda]WPB54260.1 hypothetical protein SAM46_02110 [Mycoplasmopsis verecunda]SJZ42832.1 glucose-6-phosphate isomerase [Mycoplasmopsis verecunda]